MTEISYIRCKSHEVTLSGRGSSRTVAFLRLLLVLRAFVHTIKAATFLLGTNQWIYELLEL